MDKDIFSEDDNTKLSETELRGESINFDKVYINRMIIPDIFGNHISGLDHGIPSKEKSVNGYSSFVGKYSFEWNGKSNKI